MKIPLPALNITQQFLAYLVFLSVIPLLLVGFVSYHIAYTALKDEASRYALALVANQKNYLELKLEQIESLIANLSGVEAIINALDEQQATATTYESLATQARIGYILNGYSNLRGLVSIDIFTTGGSHYHVGDTLNVGNIQTQLKDRIFAQALETDQPVLWLGIEDNVNANSAHHKVITAAKALTKMDRQTLQRRPLALLLVNYSVAHLYDHFSGVDLGRNAYLMIVDAQHRIIYHPDKRLLGRRADLAFLGGTTAAKVMSVAPLDGQPTSISQVHCDRSGWTVLGFIPLNTLTAKMSSISTATLLIMIVCFCVVGLAAVLYNQGVVAPLRKVTNHFKQFQTGALDLNTRLKVRRRDEIGELIRWFNAFVVASLAARQASERALRESEERFALTARSTNDGLWDWDLQTDQIYFSPRWKEMLGYSDNEIGQSPQEWLGRVHPEDLAQVECEIAAHVAGLTPNFISEHRLLHKDGNYRWVLVRGLAVGDGSGAAYRMGGSHTDITEHKRIDAQFRHDALHDSLTDLPNRACLLDRLQSAIDRSVRREGYLFAVLFLDLDHFKHINDSLGHNIGDQLLIEVAQRLQKCVRTTDTVARLGGDEFVILLEDPDEFHFVTHVAERILESLTLPVELNKQPVPISTSIGIAVSSTGYDRPETMLRDADIAMYRAKALGKARYEIFDTAMGEEVVKRLALEMDLRRAIECEAFQLHYQPIVAMQNGMTIGFEALLRWPHPERGMVPPAEFISLAEETGLIAPIGEWVLRTACTQAKAWQAQANPAPYVAVNFSARQLLQSSIVNMVQQVLQETGLEAHYLELEMTESLLMQDTLGSLATLDALKAMNLKLAIDDFGTGYSSLAYLKRFPIDQLKIDQSFVQDITTDPDDAAIASAVIAMAHSLNLEVVAEGVETEAQLAFLKTGGCDKVQGYYVSPPLPADEATRFLGKATHL